MDVYKGLAYNQLPPTHIYVLKYVCCKSFQEFQGGPGPNKSHQTTFRSTSYCMPPWLFSLSIFVTISHILKICDLGFPSACWLVWWQGQWVSWDEASCCQRGSFTHTHTHTHTHNYTYKYTITHTHTHTPNWLLCCYFLLMSMMNLEHVMVPFAMFLVHCDDALTQPFSSPRPKDLSLWSKVLIGQDPSGSIPA